MPGLTKKQKRDAVTKADARCTVAFGGSFCRVELLYAISLEAMESALYDPAPTHGVDDDFMPSTPREDGTYLLIENVWMRDDEA